MSDVSTDAVTLDLLREARETVRNSPLGVINTPMIPWCQTTLPLSVSCNVHIKLCMRSLGLEVLEAVPDPDVVVVCCGGGGLLAGVAAAVKLSGCDTTRIYGVEPEGACTMYQSFIEKKPVWMDTHSIASGLAPPSAGRLPFELCRLYVEQIVLVSDDEIRAAVSALYRAGLVVEPSGSAAFAALVNDKIPDLEGKTAVCVLSGGNVGKDELANFPD